MANDSTAVQNGLKGLASQATRLRSNKGQKDCLEQLKCDPTIIVSVDELDTDPYLLNCENGTVDLRNGKLQPHSQEDLISRIADAAYDPEARSDIWDGFIKEITSGDADFAAEMQAAFGYSLTGVTTERAFFFIYGVTGTGKTSLEASVGRMLGSYAQNIGFDTLLRKPPTSGDAPLDDLARLEGVRYAYASEMNPGRMFDIQTVKTLTGGGDPITARSLHARNRTFQPRLKLWLVANDRPEIPETDDAMWSRLHIFPFKRQFLKAEQDRSLWDKLNTPEVRSAMLAWAVQGCLRWQEEGLHISRASKIAATQYKQAMDPLNGFFLAECQFVSHYSIRTDKLFAAYKMWCEVTRRDLQFSTSAVFGKRLAESGAGRGVDVQKRSVTGFANKLSVASGIDLTPEAKEQMEFFTSTNEGDTWTQPTQ